MSIYLEYDRKGQAQSFRPSKFARHEMISKEALTAEDAYVNFTVGTPDRGGFRYLVYADFDSTEQQPTWPIFYANVPKGSRWKELGIIHPDGTVERTPNSPFVEDSSPLVVARLVVRCIWDGKEEPVGYTIRLNNDEAADTAQGPAHANDIDYDSSNANESVWDEDDTESEDRRDDDFADDEAEEDNPKCPICGTPVHTDRCDHIISTWKYGDDGGEWAGDYRKPERLRELVNQLIEKLQECFLESQLELLDRLFEDDGWIRSRGDWESLMEQVGQTRTTTFSESQRDVIQRIIRLPERLAKPVIESIKEQWFACEEWDNYLAELVVESPGIVGAADCEVGGGGTSSTWITYWGQDKKKCGDYLDERLDQDLKLLDEIARSAEAVKPEAT